MTKWDYRIYILDDAEASRAEEEKRLNVLGSQDWELVTVCFRVGTAPFVFFKRPIEESNDGS